MMTTETIVTYDNADIRASHAHAAQHGATLCGAPIAIESQLRNRTPIAAYFALKDFKGGCRACMTSLKASDPTVAQYA